MNSGLIKMQFFIMLLYFHRKNEINKNFYDGAFLVKVVNVNYFRKKAPLDWAINTPLPLYVCYLHGLSSPYGT